MPRPIAPSVPVIETSNTSAGYVEVPAFEIKELTGSGRSVVLRGRALPNQNVAFPRMMRTKKTSYAGNPVATQQVLGIDFPNTSIEGIWSTRYLTGQVTVDGFDDVASAEDLVRLFEDLLRSGNTLRVTWGPVVRFGAMVQFEPKYVRLDDVAFMVEFEWYGERETSPRASAAPNEQQSNVRSSALDVDDRIVVQPPNLQQSFLQNFNDVMDEVRTGTGLFFDGTRAIQGSSSLLPEDVAAVLAAVNTMRDAIVETQRGLVDQSYLNWQLSDNVVDVLAVESWRRSVSIAESQLAANAAARGIQLQDAVKPGALAIVTMPGDMSLRQLAQTYYGDADSWQVIADVNGFDSSIVPAGTTVIIPQPATPTR